MSNKAVRMNGREFSLSTKEFANKIGLSQGWVWAHRDNGDLVEGEHYAPFGDRQLYCEEAVSYAKQLRIDIERKRVANLRKKANEKSWGGRKRGSKNKRSQVNLAAELYKEIYDLNKNVRDLTAAIVTLCEDIESRRTKAMLHDALPI